MRARRDRRGSRWRWSMPTRGARSRSQCTGRPGQGREPHRDRLVEGQRPDALHVEARVSVRRGPLYDELGPGLETRAPRGEEIQVENDQEHEQHDHADERPLELTRGGPPAFGLEVRLDSCSLFSPPAIQSPVGEFQVVQRLPGQVVDQVPDTLRMQVVLRGARPAGSPRRALRAGSCARARSR